MGSITLVDVGMTFLGGHPTGGDATACKFYSVMVCFPGLSQCETVGCTGSAGAGAALFPPSLHPGSLLPKAGSGMSKHVQLAMRDGWLHTPGQGTAGNRFRPARLGRVVQTSSGGGGAGGGHEPPLALRGQPPGVPMGRHRAVGLSPDWGSSRFGVGGGGGVGWTPKG